MVRTRRPRALLAMRRATAERLFGGGGGGASERLDRLDDRLDDQPDERVDDRLDGRVDERLTRLARLARIADVDTSLVVADFGEPGAAAALREAEVLLTGWGCPPIDAAVLAAAPRLRAVVHAAGSVKSHVTDACWERGLAVSSAAAANAVPVAEYTLATILLAGKRVLWAREVYRERRSPIDPHSLLADAGNYGRRVGLVGASQIGRRVIELLRPFDLEVAVHDPYLTDGAARDLGVRKAGGLDELCASSDILSVHAPQTPATWHLVGRAQLALLPDGATLINTSRGSLVDQAALVEELVSGRISAVVDVTEPEVPPADSPLYDLPNVLLTPHVAGSTGNEVHRLADAALDELARFAQGRPFAHPVHRADLDRTA